MKAHYHWLHYLRGIAALMIVIFHLPHGTEESITFHVSQHLWLFVDLFFVLSGFVNSQSIKGTRGSTFITKRAIRIIPLLSLVNAAQLLVYVRSDLFSMSIFDTLAQQYPKMLESLLLTDSSPLFGIGYGLNMVTWSISAELICYSLLWASFRTNSKSWVLPVSFILGGAVTMAHFDVPSATSSEWGILRALIGFGFGWLLGVVQSEVQLKPNRLRIKWILAASFFTLVPFMLDKLPGYFSTVLIAGMFAVIVFLSTHFPEIGNRVIHKFLNRLGDWSYALYLTHTLVLGFVIPRVDTATSSITTIFTVALCVLVSFFVHVLVDFPLQSFFRRKFLRLSE